jgi:histidine triad (HIT) family protein
MSDCLFCKIINKEIPANIVKENDNFLAFHDISPQAPTHILCIPKRHYGGIREMKNADEVGNLVLFANEIAINEKLEQGYRFVINQGLDGGQSVFHTHLHILGGRKLTWPPG